MIFTMAPLSRSDHSESVFTAERFTKPLRDELDEVIHHVIPSKRISFGPVSVINPMREYYSDDDISIKWYNKEDLNALRSEAKEVSKDLLEQGKTGECRLSTAHHKISLMLKKDLQRLIRLSPTTPDQDLRRWCATTDGRRGLERFSSRDYGLLRRKDITSSRKAVFEEQTRQRESGIVDPEEIARLCRLYSRRPRTVAIFFGEADAVTARLQRDGPPVRSAPPRKRSKIGTLCDGGNVVQAMAALG